MHRHRWVKESLATNTTWFEVPSDPRVTSGSLAAAVHPAVLQLVQASLRDPSSRAMPFPVFVGTGWVLQRCTMLDPFSRLGLWVAYMEVGYCIRNGAILVVWASWYFCFCVA